MDFQFSFGINNRFLVGNLLETVRSGTYILPAGHKAPYRPKKTKEGLVNFPNKIREQLEEGIETYSNLISVALNCTRQISSGNPILALRPEDNDDLRYLQEATGFIVKNPPALIAKGSYSFDPEQHVFELNDRLDGVALMAEYLAAGTATGKLREAIRFFERAFRTGGHQIIGPLTQFLGGTVFGYTEQEVKKWLIARDGATHADQRDDVALEIDCAWFTERLEQASYDVLINKEIWRSPDPQRRSMWRPKNGTTKTDLDMFMVKGPEHKMQWKIFDQFRKFPSNLEGNFSVDKMNMWSGPMATKTGGLFDPKVVMQQQGKMHVFEEGDTDFFLKPVQTTSDGVNPDSSLTWTLGQQRL
ncbi:hypothetical protein ACQKQD_05010 [Methylobacterium sp. NPDC080182]|uniref:hypothetical protein n=1 Tax=Methylobacterium sp. NPDC080182 TaxID=3390590 RepID=UPI003D093A75